VEYLLNLEVLSPSADFYPLPFLLLALSLVFYPDFLSIFLREGVRRQGSLVLSLGASDHLGISSLHTPRRWCASNEKPQWLRLFFSVPYESRVEMSEFAPVAHTPARFPFSQQVSVFPFLQDPMYLLTSIGRRK